MDKVETEGWQVRQRIDPLSAIAASHARIDPPYSALRCLTLDAEWAWGVLHGPKRVENRLWRTRHRGPLALHCGLSTRSRDIARDLFSSIGYRLPSELPRGVVLGIVEVVDVVEFAQASVALRADPLAFGPFCWLLDKPRPLPAPIPFAGQQRLYSLPPEIVRKINRALAR